MSTAAQAMYIAAGVGFCATETDFNTEQEAIREVDPRRSRVWKIKNPHSRNSVTGTPVVPSNTEVAPNKGSFTLVPSESSKHPQGMQETQSLPARGLQCRIVV